MTALKHYHAPAWFERVVVLEERQHRWHALADANLGPPVVVGRGGLELEITEGRLLGPDVLAMTESQFGWLGGSKVHSNVAQQATLPGPGAKGETIVLTGRREGSVAGAAAAWSSGRTGDAVNVSVLVEPTCRRQGVGRALLVALEVSVRRRGWAAEGVRGYGPLTFFNQSSGWIRTVAPTCVESDRRAPGDGGPGDEGGPGDC
jgi:GNAT superfamily N-acetyltransferase